MPKGYSLHLGLQEVSQDFYGTTGFLMTPASDAETFFKIAQSQNYERSEVLINENATTENFLKYISEFQTELESGDIFFLTFSGHGQQTLDKNGDEEDGRDEAWCLYNGRIIDDLLYEIWHDFKEGVRIFVIADCCHGGTSVRSVNGNKKQKNGIQKAKTNDKPKEVSATVRLIASTQDDELAFDGAINSRFVSVLLNVWKDGNFEGTYRDFYRNLRNKMPLGQSPNHMVFGRKNEAFDSGVPFRI